MTITITAGGGERRGGSYQSRDQATATGTLSPTTDYSLIPGSTATGFGNYGFTLADGRDGQRKEIYMTSTGEATVHLTGTATGAFVLDGEDDAVSLRFHNSKWRLISNSGATFATAT